MNTSLIVKLNFLVLGLVLVIFGISSLRNRGLPSGVAELFGAAPGAASSSTASSSLKWCETRVRSLIQPSGFQLEQKGMKWIGETETEKELNFIAIEKWFGRHCQLLVNPVALEAAEKTQFNPILFVQFIDQTAHAFGYKEGGVYTWRGQTFRSEQLDLALKELKDLVGLTAQD